MFSSIESSAPVRPSAGSRSRGMGEPTFSGSSQLLGIGSGGGSSGRGRGSSGSSGCSSGTGTGLAIKK